MKKIALSLLLIFFAHSCTAQLIDLRSALSFFSENKLITTLCAIGAGSIFLGKVVDSNREAAKAKIDIFQRRNESKISEFLKKERQKNIKADEFCGNEYDKMINKCATDAKTIANLIGSRECPFTAGAAEQVRDIRSAFYQARVISGTINYKNIDISGCTKIEQKEQLACWVPKIAYTLGGLSLLSAGIVVAANKK